VISEEKEKSADAENTKEIKIDANSDSKKQLSK